jgi:hypothetical protein
VHSINFAPTNFFIEIANGTKSFVYNNITPRAARRKKDQLNLSFLLSNLIGVTWLVSLDMLYFSDGKKCKISALFVVELSYERYPRNHGEHK